MLRKGLWGGLVVALCGCAANPTVRYQSLTEGQSLQQISPRLIDTYYLQKNQILLEWKNTAAQGKPPVNELVVTNTRLEDQAHRMLLLRGDQPWTRTTINLVKVENSDLIASAGVEVADRRAELLQSAGTVLKTLAPLGFGVAGGAPQPLPQSCQAFPQAPCLLVPSDDLAIEPQSGSVGDPKGLRLSWGAVPPTAVRRDTLLASLNGQRLNGLYYAACREFSVTFYQPAAIVNGTSVPAALSTWRGKFADPRWVEYVAFPRKGSVRMHSQCGVSTTSEKDPTLTTDALISAAVTQAMAVKEAIDKANANGAK